MRCYPNEQRYLITIAVRHQRLGFAELNQDTVKPMTIFLSIAFCLSLAEILLGYWADRSAVTARINGTNGLPILVALIVSAGGSLAVAVIAGLFGGWAMLGWVLLFAIPYHIILGTLLISRLQSLATRASRAEAANSKQFADMFKKPGKP